MVNDHLKTGVFFLAQPFENRTIHKPTYEVKNLGFEWLKNKKAFDFLNPQNYDWT